LIVPNYIPEPLEVPGNIAEQGYAIRLQFLRRVTWLFSLSVVLESAASRIDIPSLGLPYALILLAVVLLGLEVWRIATRGKRLESIVSGVVLPLPVLATALLAREVRDLGWPVWPVIVGVLCMLAYTQLCGRDYSFIGNFLLSLIASSVVVAGVGTTLDLSSAQITFGMILNAIVLGYVLYDLASLMSRRRWDEQTAAVTDIYRDVFNFLGYFVRVFRHWRKHRLLSVPTPIEIGWRRRH
jgi:hypothetical protein